MEEFYQWRDSKLKAIAKGGINTIRSTRNIIEGGLYL